MKNAYYKRDNGDYVSCKILNKKEIFEDGWGWQSEVNPSGYKTYYEIEINSTKEKLLVREGKIRKSL